MTELEQSDQLDALQPDSEGTIEMRQALHDHHMWREQSNRQEARADDVLFQRVVDLGQDIRTILTRPTQQD